METNRLRSLTAGNRGGKSPHRKMVLISLLIAAMLASFPAVRVFATPPKDPPLPEEQERILEQAWKDERSQLATEITFFSTFRPIPELSVNPANQRRQLDMYRAAITDAQALVIDQTGFDDEGHVISLKRADQTIQELTGYLNRIRGLKQKLGAGRTPVAPTSQSTTNVNAAQDLVIQQEWAAKQMQVAAEIAFFIEFRTNPAQYGNDDNQGKYLDKYRVAIITAQYLAANHYGFDASGRVVDTDRASESNRQLAETLHTIRGLRDKLGG
jgi:hypothetical protein